MRKALSPLSVLAMELSAEELASFATPPQQVVVRGPQVLVRFTGSKEGRGGAFWVWADDVVRIWRGTTGSATPTSSVKRLREEMRTSLAVRHDWSSMDYMFRMTVPAGVSVPCWLGVVAGQRRYWVESGYQRSAAIAERAARFEGGMVQYLIRVTPRIDALIDGPHFPGVLLPKLDRATSS